MAGTHQPIQLERLLALGGSSSPFRSSRILLAEFGTFGGVVAGPAHRLEALLAEDVEAFATLRWFRSAMLAALRPAVGERLTLSSWRALTRYLRAEMGFSRSERLRALFLDARNRLIADEEVASGSGAMVALEMRHILARALDLGATGLILVHNHPSGDTTPSRSDLTSTRKAIELCGALDIDLHDHVIVGGGRCTSMRKLGLLTS